MTSCCPSMVKNANHVTKPSKFGRMSKKRSSKALQRKSKSNPIDDHQINPSEQHAMDCMSSRRNYTNLLHRCRPPLQFPYCSDQFLVRHESPYGPVTGSVYNGTTFYHYHNKKFQPKSGNDSEKLASDDRSICCNKPKKDATEKFGINHLPSPLLTSGPSSSSPLECCFSFASISPASSRSSSPYLLSTQSSARDSGLISTESTDDDASFIHRANFDSSKEELLQTIKKTAEAVLSDEHLSKESYLFRQMNRSPDGYVNIKLLGCSKKIKKLTSNCSHSMLVLALKSSDKLEVNSSSTKVRRTLPLPENSVSVKTPSSLLLINPKDIKGIDDVTQLLKNFGELSQVRIIRPGKPLPRYLKGYINTHPQLGQVLCVIIEFEDERSVFSAFKSLVAKNEGVQVAILGSKKKFPRSHSQLPAHLKEPALLENESNMHSRVSITRLQSGDSIQSEDSGVCPDEFDQTLLDLPEDAMPNTSI